MRTTRRRALGAGVAAVGLAAFVAGTPSATAHDRDRHHPRPYAQTVQLLSFNDYHGHLEATDPPLSKALDPSQTAAGGAEHLATALKTLRAQAPRGTSLTVAAGDLIGGSTFLSGLFHDEPSVETLNAMDLDVSSVGNHEFDEGTTELLRMQKGGCHPKDGCYFPDDPYAGADFQWLAANVVVKPKTSTTSRGHDHGKERTLLPATSIKKVNGVKIGFIGMTLEGTPSLVDPAGVANVEFKDEVETANQQAVQLRRKGVNAIVVLLHEGGVQSGTYEECVGISDPIATIAKTMTADVDAIITGHTHQPYTCSIPDPKGNPRLVTSAASYGQVVSETDLVIDRRTGEVDRGRSTSVNHLVSRAEFAKDPEQTAIIDKWKTISAPLAARVVGSVAEDITGDSGGNRGIETPMADLVADSILWGTRAPENGGAQLALMNVGGVRASLRVAPKYAEGPGEITYAETYDVAPFGNILTTLDLTGAELKAVLEQQYVPGRAGGRDALGLGVSDGFTYTWDATQPAGSRVVAGSMKLGGTVMDMNATYRVGTINFLANGGDSFTAFSAGRNVLGGNEDLANMVAYFGANPGLRAPADRVAGL
ncbi:bifunctional metallophosphatase/5'-nucleotidase [Phycicoccus sonneratiae]|uniref:Bifunctional metallophosphatase/5'-nucleotidase n=1 Tax=Phycicoccus sonneratiae TaxID=2807628 RepID=A0ABS2CJZ6_9MICO|nr:bifunctional metallophosphatase/5'-nucleotidase [Phycicoccus sonneraticus]MBM6400202.1 bifunctional metallophosphatase/5'-nucleotidase [Phycicoccus sonneraticus]